MQETQYTRLDTKTVVSRCFIVITVVPALCAMTFVVFASYFTGYFEFTMALPIWARKLGSLPQVAEWHRYLYAWGWLGPALSSLAAIVLVCRRQCTLGALALFIGLMVLFTTFWLVFSLLAMQLCNQVFHVVT